MGKKITKEQIKHVANLAKLELSELEITRYEHEFNSILDYVAQIEEVDVSSINDAHNLEDYVGNVMQEDIEHDYKIDQEDYLKNATEGRVKNKYIRTSRMVE